MKKTLRIISIQVVFELPEWTSDEQFDKEIVERYSGGHAYAGQFEKYMNENIISLGLADIRLDNPEANVLARWSEVVEICLIGYSPSVTVVFYCGIDDLHIQVKLFQSKLRKFLNYDLLTRDIEAK